MDAIFIQNQGFSNTSFPLVMSMAANKRCRTNSTLTNTTAVARTTLNTVTFLAVLIIGEERGKVLIKKDAHTVQEDTIQKQDVIQVQLKKKQECKAKHLKWDTAHAYKQRRGRSKVHTHTHTQIHQRRTQYKQEDK